VEGCQAARASDYSIPEFKHLKYLLFKYGREYYRKNSIMVLYSFWKNIVLVLPQFMYSLFFNNFSGVTLYDAFMYQLVNMFYTSMPIMIYCLFDKELTGKSLLGNPDYYFVGLRNMYFNIYIFSLWIIFGITQAVCIAIASSFLEFHPQKGGRYLGFWGFGIFVFFITQIVANLKILVFSNSYGFLTIFFIGGGILLFILSFLIISSIVQNYHYRIFQQLLTQPMVYMVMGFLLIICNFFDHLWELVQKMLFFRYINLEPWLFEEDR
jgi:phospholipid-transporting ATPase